MTRPQASKRDVQWRANLAAFTEAVEFLGYEPPSTQDDPHAISGRWIAQQRKAAAKGVLPPRRAAELDAARPGWRAPNTDDARWRARLATFVALTASLGREPDTASNDPVESKSARWVAGQRYETSVGTLEPSRVAALEAAGIGWQPPTDAPWQAKLDAYVGLVDLLGREPSRRSKDAKEKQGAQWISTQRGHVTDGVLSSRRSAVLDESLPGWREPNAHEVGWKAHLADLVDSVERLGRNPSQADTDPRDRRARVWLTSQRNLARIGELRGAHLAELESAVPAWRGRGSRARTWEDRLAGMVALEGDPNQATGPGSPGAGRGTHRRWLARQRYRARTGKLPAGQAAALDAALPGWLESGMLDGRWREHLAAYVELCRSNDMDPNRGSQSAVEAVAARWLETQRQQSKLGTQPGWRAAALDAAHPGWRVPDRADEGWRISLRAYLEASARLGRRPSVTSADQVDAACGRWLAVQWRAARAGTLAPWRVAALAGAWPGWLGVDDARWRANLATAAAMAVRLGRDPSTASKVLAEKRAGQWASRQRKAAKAGTLAPRRRSELDATWPGWDDAKVQ